MTEEGDWTLIKTGNYRTDPITYQREALVEETKQKRHQSK